MFSQAVLLTIWLALGRQALMFRVSIWLAGQISLFSVFSANWLVGSSDEWDIFAWLTYFGGDAGARLVFVTPGMLITVAAPLLIRRLSCGNAAGDNLTLRHLMTSIACLCISLALLTVVSPDQSWLVQLVAQVIGMSLDLPILFTFAVIPTVAYSVIAFASMWCALHVVHHRLWVLAVTVAISATLAIVVRFSSRLLFQDISISTTIVFIESLEYLTAIILVAGAIYVLMLKEAHRDAVVQQ